MPRRVTIPGARVPPRGRKEAILRALRLLYNDAPYSEPEEHRQAVVVARGKGTPVRADRPEETGAETLVTVPGGPDPVGSAPEDGQQGIVVGAKRNVVRYEEEPVKALYLAEKV